MNWPRGTGTHLVFRDKCKCASLLFAKCLGARELGYNLGTSKQKFSCKHVSGTPPRTLLQIELKSHLMLLPKMRLNIPLSHRTQPKKGEGGERVYPRLSILYVSHERADTEHVHLRLGSPPGGPQWPAGSSTTSTASSCGHGSSSLRGVADPVGKLNTNFRRKEQKKKTQFQTTIPQRAGQRRHRKIFRWTWRGRRGGEQSFFCFCFFRCERGNSYIANLKKNYHSNQTTFYVTSVSSNTSSAK